MNKKHVLRGVMCAACLFFVLACDGSLLVSLYTSDMLTVARQSETVLYTSVTIIASGLKEEKDIEFLRNNLNSFSNERIIKHDYSDALTFTVKVPIVNENFQGTFDSSKDLLFIYANDKPDRIDYLCKYNSAVLDTISTYLKNEHFQTFNWNDLTLSLKLENDLQEPVSVLAYSSFINGEPYPFSAAITLNRRDHVDIEFSNVLRNSIVKGKKPLVVSIKK